MKIDEKPSLASICDNASLNLKEAILAHIATSVGYDVEKLRNFDRIKNDVKEIIQEFFTDIYSEILGYIEHEFPSY